MKTTLVETTESFTCLYKNSICQILNEPNAALATSNFTYSWMTRTGPNPVPFAMYKNSDAKRDLNSTFFSESLGGTRGGRWKTTYLEKSHHTAGSVASESSPLSEASIVLEHVTWWVTRWEPFHHSFELENKIAGLVALKLDPWGGFWTW